MGDVLKARLGDEIVGPITLGSYGAVFAQHGGFMHISAALQPLVFQARVGQVVKVDVGLNERTSHALNSLTPVRHPSDCARAQVQVTLLCPRTHCQAA